MQPSVHHQLLEAIRSYRAPREVSELIESTKPMVLSGVTAAGKDTIMQHIEEISEWRHVVTHTTRKPRLGEENGKSHWFVNEEEMLSNLKSGGMIEAKAIHGETVYGSSIQAYKDVVDSGHKPILRIDIQGVEELANFDPDLQSFFILPPNFEVWMERLDKRGRMSHIERIQRLRSAQTELKTALQSRHFIFIVNREYPDTSKEILKGHIDGPTQHRNRELALQLIDHIAHF